MHSIPSVRTYVIVWAILTVMTFVTYYVAQIELGAWNIVVALLIAFFKMMLVIMIFMNLKADQVVRRWRILLDDPAAGTVLHRLRFARLDAQRADVVARRAPRANP
jgi:cytochrome c oxidase subunit 4